MNIQIENYLHKKRLYQIEAEATVNYWIRSSESEDRDIPDCDELIIEGVTVESFEVWDQNGEPSDIEIPTEDVAQYIKDNYESLILEL